MTYANNKRAAFTLLLLSGLALRVYISTFGHNSDLESYQIVADLMASGKSVYANTSRYNYGPVWFCVLWGLKSIQNLLGWTGAESFHSLVAFFLSLVDAAIAITMARVYGYRAGIFFFINPISILITGNHSQFDNFALLIGLFAWVRISTRQKRERRNNLLASAVILGLSLSVKHILVFFPLWILVWTSEIDVKRKLEYCTIAFGLFFVGFLPWAFDPPSRSGILHNVIQYSSMYGTGILPQYVNPLDMILPPSVIWLVFPVFYDASGIWFNSVKGFKYLWPIAIVATGRMTAKFAPDRAIFIYILIMVSLSPALAEQYLAIPVIVCAYYWRSKLLWIYTIAGTLHILMAMGSLGTLDHTPLFGAYSRLSGNQLFLSLITYAHLQFILLLFLISSVARSLRRLPLEATISRLEVSVV
jgi:hypothetical protein